MSSPSFDESNPFEAPKAAIGNLASQVDDADLEAAELTRRQYIGHESSIKTLGIFAYLCSVPAFLGMITMFVVAIVGPPPNPDNSAEIPAGMLRLILIGGGLFYLAVASVFGLMGFGLRRLHAWSRWTVVVFDALAWLYILGIGIIAKSINLPAGTPILLMGSLIAGFIMYLMVTPKSSIVFSSHYKIIILKTKHLNTITGVVLRTILAFIIMLVFLFIAGLIVFLQK